MRYTPGPWKRLVGQRANETDIVALHSSRLVATVYEDVPGPGMSCGNADLISCATELIEAGERMLAWYDSYVVAGDPEGRDEYLALKRAVARAHGNRSGHAAPATCELCGEPMPAGEEMFKYHGYSGPCPSSGQRARAHGEGR